MKSPSTSLNVRCYVLCYEPAVDAILILLTERNADIQKSIVFQNVFEKPFEILKNEEGIDGGVIIQDCLTLMSNLIKFNVPNQVIKTVHTFRKTILESFQRMWMYR